MECLEMLYEKTTGQSLHVIKHGKPHRPTYVYAERALLQQLRDKGLVGSDVQHLHAVYCVGDNPTSDVRGANNAGPPFTSILVRTGCFEGGPGENDPRDPAHHVVDHVLDAVTTALRIEGRL
jgi:ribonucleotide monophosphatase NagD (HAD superfamily)